MDDLIESPTIASAADEWLAGLWARNHITSPHTEIAYRSDLRAWTAAIGGTTETLRVDALTPTSIEMAAGVLAQDHAPSTRRRMFASLSGFTGWCVWKGRLEANPLASSELKIIRSRGQRLPKHIAEADLRRLFAAAAIEPERSRNRSAERDGAILAVLVGTGVRSAELCGLAITDLLELEPPFLHVRGKGGHQRRIPIDRNVQARLSAWLDVRERRVRDDTAFAKMAGDTLFVTAKGRPFTAGAIRHLILSLFAQAKVTPPQGATIHGFRHTFAYRLVAAGVPLPVVQALMGHRSMATTSIYVRMTSEDSIRAIGQLGLGGLLGPI